MSDKFEQCPICLQYVSSTEIHHVIPREVTLNGIKGIDGPTVALCSTCHSHCHKQAMALMSKTTSSKKTHVKKQFFTEDDLVRATPYVRVLMKAIQVQREDKSADSNQKLILTFTALEIEQLHNAK